MKKNSKILCIIPARGGSKRITKKNIKKFIDKPIIGYSIELAIKSGIFDEIMVSTDDDEIVEYSVKQGAKVPFKRSERNSRDSSSTESVILEVLDNYIERGTQFDFICCIYPTAVLLQEKHLKKGLEIIQLEKNYSVFAAAEFPHPIWRAFRLNKLGNAEPIWPPMLDKRSQELEVSFHDIGYFYWLNSKEFHTKKALFEPSSKMIIVERILAQDIDNLEDWSLAEFKYTYKEKQLSFE